MRNTSDSGRRLLQATSVIAGCLGIAACALAQTFPNKPILIIASTAPGGPVDITARTVAPEMAKILGQPVNVENRPGASQKIGTLSMLRAPKDGYTIATVSPASMTINPLMDRTVGYDPLKDFTYLTYAVESPLVVMVHPKLPVRSMQELVAYGRANPQKITFGTGGNGTAIHFATESMLSKVGVTGLHVPYKSDAPAHTALVAGEILMLLPVAAIVKPYVDSGRLFALATTGRERWEQLPNVPTVSESGVPELKGHSHTVWIGFAAMAGLPPEIATKLSDALIRALRLPEVRESFRTRAMQVVGSTPQEFAAKVRAELESNRKLIESGAIKQEQRG
ncbi:MAG: tripartite tricarboxylate transporter substrate binding protein [Betaproteobacteria bacterium]|nr:tripartite tricarboxylate transporter substrate binding protein [Betaproteobacteria bacterium]